jgi:hypothetical protein
VTVTAAALFSFVYCGGLSVVLVFFGSGFFLPIIVSSRKHNRFCSVRTFFRSFFSVSVLIAFCFRFFSVKLVLCFLFRFTALFFVSYGGSRSAADLVVLLALFMFPANLFHLSFFLRRVCLCLLGTVRGYIVGGDGSRFADLDCLEWWPTLWSGRGGGGCGSRWLWWFGG